MEFAKAKIVNRAAATHKPAAAVAITAPAPSVQRATRVSSPGEPAEREAEATAKHVMRMSVPEGSIRLVPSANGGVYRQVDEKERKPRISPHVARFAHIGPWKKSIDEKEKIQRKAEGPPRASSDVTAEIRASMSAGTPLPASVRRFMEPRFGADFSGVRIHSDERAASLNRQVSARAFTYGNHIFFGKGQYQPDSPDGRELMAHELTHTIHQGSVRQTRAVQRSEDVSVGYRSPPGIQRLGVSDVLNFFADAANAIPGYRMFTVVLGVNPINMSRVERNAANILRAVVELIPGGNLIVRALDAYGVFDRVGAWVEQQLNTLGITGASIRAAIDRFLSTLGWSDILHLGSVWERARSIFTEPIARIGTFVRNLGSAILDFIREAILRPLAALASQTRGWDLLKAVLGRDPITGEAVPRNAETLIGGFMKLIGQEEIWTNIQRANAIPRAWAWFQGAISGLVAMVTQIPQMFLDALKALQINDLVELPTAFARVGRVFLGFFERFFTWAGTTVMSLLEIIFEVVAPSVVPVLKRAAGAFSTIIRDPIGFVGNLVRAGVAGFQAFSTNFLTHLRASLIAWLTGTLSDANIYIPQAFNVREILKFVLSVLGLTWQNIRQKLVRVAGEPAVRAMEAGFDLIRKLVTEGPAAAWQQILEGISNLREMVMDQIMAFVQSRIVEAAITRLLTSLNPAGAFIQAIIAIYNTVMFFIERLRQIGQVVTAFLESIGAIAAGSIGAAASRVERTMAGLLTLVISFLARLVGLGKVSDAVVQLVQRVRGPIDRALDRVVAWIVAQARRLGRFVAQAGAPQDPNERLRLGQQAALAAVHRFSGRRVGNAVLAPLLAGIRLRYGFSRLDVFPRQGRWHLAGQINPDFSLATEVLTPADLAPGEGRSTLLIGEGNFTFALSIAMKIQRGGRLVATDFIVKERKSLEKTAEEQRRNEVVARNIHTLEQMGVQVERQVDARDPNSYPSGNFDVIVFNHPLVLTRTQQGRTIRGSEVANVNLINQFLTAAKSRIAEGGQIIVISSLYRLSRWQLDHIAESFDQHVKKFLASEFPGYGHELTEGSGSASTVVSTEQFAIIFSISSSKSK
jgi:hypothetical protein